jgi:hypothetical protein
VRKQEKKFPLFHLKKLGGMAMEKIFIMIKTGNAAFDEDYPGREVARILRKLADRVENEEYPSKLMDSNGNAVGKVETE